MPPKIIAIINMKGGVGKTTLSWNLTINLFKVHKKRVLLVDLDPQANATLLGLDETERVNHKKTKKTVADLFLNCYKKYGPFPKPEPAPISDYTDFLFRCEESSDKSSYYDLLPSELDLSSVLKGAYVDPFMLEKTLKSSFFDRYEYILIDCAPTNSILTTLALNAARKILVPVMMDTFAIYGAELMKEVIETHKEDYDVKIDPIGLVFMRYKTPLTQYQEQYKSQIVKVWGSTTFRTGIKDSASYNFANGKRESITDSPARADVKEEFIDFLNEFIEQTDNLIK